MCDFQNYSQMQSSVLPTQNDPQAYQQSYDYGNIYTQPNAYPNAYPNEYPQLDNGYSTMPTHYSNSNFLPMQYDANVTNIFQTIFTLFSEIKSLLLPEANQPYDANPLFSNVFDSTSKSNNYSMNTKNNTTSNYNQNDNNDNDSGNNMQTGGGSGGSGNAPKVKYDSDVKNGKIDTQGADYIIVVKSSGRKQNELDDGFFGTSGGQEVGTVGSKDKAMQLIDVRDTDSINLASESGAVQIMRLDTDGRALKIDNPTSNSNPLSGAMDPMLGKEKGIKRDAGSDFAIYSDDESKYENRVNAIKQVASDTFFSGDDSAYVLTSTEAASVYGNGAIMQLSYA